MARSSTVRDHDRRAEIDAAVAGGWSNRKIAAAFGVSKDAVRRYREAGTTLTTPPSARPPHQADREFSPQVDPFDLIEVHYPWQEGETRSIDPLAGYLRTTQRQLGTAAVRDAALSIIAEHTRAGVTDQVVGRKLDVPPALVAAWRAEEERAQLARLTHDPRSVLARELVNLEQRERLAWQKLRGAGVGSKAWAAAQAVLNQTARQRLAVLREAGVRLEAPSGAPEDHAMRLAREVQEAIIDLTQGLAEAWRVVDQADPSAVSPSP